MAAIFASILNGGLVLKNLFHLTVNQILEWLRRQGNR